MSDAIIKLIDVKRYFDDGLVRALCGVSLNISRGEHVAVTGPSGSGKSTLLHIIGALDFPSSGEVYLMGQEVTPKLNLDHLRSNVLGFVFQLHHLIPNLTLVENIMVAMQPRGVPASEARDRAEVLLERVNLVSRRNALPVKVSAGERQRAALARALANDPQIVLADEPTGSLDSKNSDLVLDMLIGATEDRTLLVVTHNPEIAARLGRVITLVDGGIVSDAI